MNSEPLFRWCLARTPFFCYNRLLESRAIRVSSNTSIVLLNELLNYSSFPFLKLLIIICFSPIYKPAPTLSSPLCLFLPPIYLLFFSLLLSAMIALLPAPSPSLLPSPSLSIPPPSFCLPLYLSLSLSSPSLLFPSRPLTLTFQIYLPVLQQAETPVP